MERAYKRGSMSSVWMCLYEVFVGVRERNKINGERMVFRGAGSGEFGRTLSSSSRYMSARWNARLVGTRVSSGLENVMISCLICLKCQRRIP